jgi:hypothetical protein
MNREVGENFGKARLDVENKRRISVFSSKISRSDPGELYP